MATKIIGKVSIVPYGEWQENTTYPRLAIINYQGGAYIAITENTNIPPTEGSTWYQLVADGNGILNIEKIGSSGLIDTYRITYTNGDHFDYTLNNGATKTSELDNDAGFITNSTNDLVNYLLASLTGAEINLSYDSSGYTLTSSLINNSGTTLNTVTVQLPIGTSLINASYNDGVFTFTQRNGETITCELSDLVKTSDFQNLQDIVQDNSNRITVLEDISVQKTLEWSDIKLIVDNEQASRYFSIGDELTEDWKSTINNVDTSYSDVPMYVVDIGNATVQVDNVDTTVPAMYMEWKYEAPFSIPFCAPQCLQCFDGTEGTPNGLPAGNYAFVVKSLPNWSTARPVYQGKYLCFTLEEPIPSGGVLTGNGWGNNATWAMETKTSYLNDATTIEIPSITVYDSLPTGYTFLGETWSNDVGYGVLNWPECVPYGDNTWRDSDLRQWLNSDAEAGSWWEKKTRYNMQPSTATTHAGFLHGYSNDFISQLKTTKVASYTNTVKEKEGLIYTYDKIFIASRTQMNCNTADEGTIWAYYKALAVGQENLDASGRFKNGSTYEILKRYGLNNTSSANTYFQRGAPRAHGSIVYYCYTSGLLYDRQRREQHASLPPSLRNLRCFYFTFYKLIKQDMVLRKGN